MDEVIGRTSVLAPDTSALADDIPQIVVHRAITVEDIRPFGWLGSPTAYLWRWSQAPCTKLTLVRAGDTFQR
jgi:hypothetical protein